MSTREITPHKGGRSASIHLRLRPEMLEALDTMKQDRSRSDYLEDLIMADTINTATARIENDAELSEYRDLFIDYDWDNAEEHAAWVATADRAELLDWARGIRDAEEGRA